MPKIEIQLGNLDFDSIKQSIIDYLKTQDTLKDYDYEGSVAQVLLDILAYNTMYYGYYANMTANEIFMDTAQKESSLISLVKPLGYVVPGKTSARSTVKVRGANSNEGVPKYTKFSGNNSLGTSYTFYTMQDYAVDIDGEAVIQIIEGRNIVKELPLLVDSGTNRSFISGLDVDISTIIIEVYNRDTQEWEQWTRAGNIESNLDSKSKVYWLERSELGFFVIFGGNFNNDIGQLLTDDDQVRISYLKSSGEKANNVGSFTSTVATVDTISLSSGGTDKPDLEAIRFFAPKWFASQDRAVTVEDCRALLAKEGYVSGTDDPYSKFNVWGGEEMNPPRYGRVFVSLSDTAEQDPVAADRAKEILKEKTCVSIIPEFVDKDSFIVDLRGNIYFEPLQTRYSRDELLNQIIESLKAKYYSRFEKRIYLSEIINDINSVDSSLSASTSDLYLSVTTVLKVVNEKVLDRSFNNKMRPSSLISNNTPVTEKYYDFIDSPAKVARIRNAGVVDNTGKQKIQVYYRQGSVDSVVVSDAGYWIPETGQIVIAPGIFASDITIAAQPTISEGAQKFNLKLGMYADSYLFDGLTMSRIGVE